MLKTATFVLAALTVSSVVGFEKWAMVHEYIQDETCKEHYISKHRPACVTPDGHCHPPGHEGVECEDVETWQWHHADDEYLQYAPGVLPPPHRRMTHAGDAKQKTIWAYASSITQGLATQVYGPDRQVTVKGTLNAPINQVAFIANIQVTDPSHWFNPGQNDTDGCGQKQTWDLPYGFDGEDVEHATARFIQNLTRLKQNGVTITLTMASWCTSFPLREWTTTEFTQFVNYFKELRMNYFGGHLDGIDFDWEGYCNFTCLHEICSCDWDEKHCNDKSPEELAAGVYFFVEDTSPRGPHKPMRVQCWLLPVKETLQVMGGIAYYMKKAGFVVTLVPMSVSAWTAEEDKTEKQNLKNEYIKWRMNTYEGNEFNLLDAADGMLLQWYSGFDAGLCGLVDDPHACSCSNIQVPDYPNWHNNTRWGPEVSGLLYNYALIDAIGSNTFPSNFPVRCQSCGPNVHLPNGTVGDLQCYPDGEDYMLPGDWEKYPELITAHQNAWRNYTQAMGSEGRPGLPYWFIKNFTYTGRCPRAVDCPDWRYENEEPYSRMTKMLYSLGSVIAMDKISIGFETLGNDQFVQMKSWTDPLLPFSTASPEDHEAGTFFHVCDTNMTRKNLDQGHRCGAPTQQQQWGALFNASEIIGVEAKIRADTGKEMAGVGVFTIDGFLWEEDPQDQRMWYQPLCDLNKNYRIKCDGECCQDSHWEGLATPEHLVHKTKVENPFIF